MSKISELPYTAQRQGSLKGSLFQGDKLNGYLSFNVGEENFPVKEERW